MREKVQIAFERQLARNKTIGKIYNVQLTTPMLKAICPLEKSVEKLFVEKIYNRNFSSRGASAIWRLARTIADLEDNNQIEEMHINAAFDFREEMN